MANLKIAARGVVQIVAYRAYPRETFVRRDWSIRLIEICIDGGIARERDRCRAVHKVVGVLSADDLDE